ncbi:MAG: pyridoxal-phosphate dependent enzyme [Anaerolineales bacterium]
MSEFRVRCLDCGTEAPFEPQTLPCPACGSEWRRVRYDYPAVRRIWQEELHARPFDLWRYRELLPLRTSQIQPQIGGTPLLSAPNLGRMLGLNRLFIKDERLNPTGSFKDRQAAVTVATLSEHGIREAVVCSTGNVAIAFAAACARAGIRLWAFLTSLVPAEKMHEVAIYGTEVIKVTGTYDQAKQLAAQFAASRGLYLDRGARSLPAVESMKTISFEITEQLEWHCPDWYVQPVSGGLGPYGVLKGFSELKELGLTDKIPAVAAIQTEGCAPMAAAWKQDLEQAEPVRTPTTYITTLTTGDPGRTYTLLREQMLAEGGGTMSAVSDEAAYRALHLLAKTEGLSVEAAAAAGVAGLIQLAEQGTFKPDDVVVLNCTGHTMPVEDRLLAPDWATDVELETRPGAPRDGLLAALASLDRRRLRRILIVDDQADARRLIRRVLEARGNYALEEASRGEQALEIVDQRPPDLIVLDLMMPEMDGFTLLEKFKSRQHTRDVPVIVVTAKELSSDEWDKLEGKIERLITKGNFLSDELIDEIEQMLVQPGSSGP